MKGVYLKKNIIILILMFGVFSAKAQTSCEDLIEYVKSKSYGTTYYSYSSSAIEKVTFYDVMIDYKYYYFAVVCFKQQYSYTCKEYIYHVSSRTKLDYSSNYTKSAGEAFWKYIQPYNENLECGTKFK